MPFYIMCNVKLQLYAKGLACSGGGWGHLKTFSISHMLKSISTHIFLIVKSLFVVNSRAVHTMYIFHGKSIIFKKTFIWSFLCAILHELCPRSFQNHFGFHSVRTLHNHVAYLRTLSRAVHLSSLCRFDKAYSQNDIFDFFFLFWTQTLMQLCQIDFGNHSIIAVLFGPNVF